MKASGFSILAAALLLLSAPVGKAQSVRMWDTDANTNGAQGGTGNWLGTNFWNTIVPDNNVMWTNGSWAVFGGTPGTVTVNGAVSAAKLTFNVSGYTVAGSSTLTLTEGDDTINVSNAGHTATISAPIGGTVGLEKVGPGMLTLSGSVANSFTGLTRVIDGTLGLSKSAGVNAITGNLTIGDGTGAAASATVVQGANQQIADTAIVRIEQDGFWNLGSGNRSETIGGLEIGESSIATGTGTLTVNGDISAFVPGFDGNYPNASISGLLNLGGGMRTVTTVEVTQSGLFTTADLEISATISNGGITKAGHGSLTLSGTVANSFSGLTTVNAGLLVLNKPAGVNAIGGDLLIGDGAPHPFHPTQVTQGADEQIPNTAIVALAGDGSWYLNHRSETIAGLTITRGGISTGNALDPVGMGNLTLNGNLTMTGGGIVTDFGTLTLNGNLTATSAPTDPASIVGKLDLGGVTRVFDVVFGTHQEGDLYVTAVISNGGVTKIGSGRLDLSSASTSTFTGPVTINGGSVKVSFVRDSGVNSSLGVSSSVFFDGGTVIISGGASSSTNRAVTLNAGGGTISVLANTVTLTTALAGAGGLTKSGAGTLSLAGTMASGYGGPTSVDDGTLNLNKPAGVNAIPGDLTIGNGIGAASSAIVTQGADEQIPDSTVVPIAADGFWDLASGNRSETVAALTMTAGRIATGTGVLAVMGNVTTSANAASASISGHLHLGGTTRIFEVADGTAAHDLDVSAAILNGAGGLNKVGAGTLRLGGANAFSGPVAVNAGTLIAQNGSAIGDNSVVTVASGATLSFEGAETINSLAGNGSVSIGAGGTLTVGGSSTTTWLGSLGGAGGLTRSGAGMLTLSAAPTYAGNTLITAGTLALGNGIASAAGSMTVNAPGTLQARSIVNRAIAGDGTITATGTLVIGDDCSASGFAFDGNLHVGSHAVTLAGAGVAQLGVTTVLGANGRLDALNGSILAGGRSVTATAGGAIISSSFTNNGTVNGPTTSGQSLTFLGPVNGGGNCTGHVTFTGGYSPGSGPAIVTLENATFGAANTLTMELGGTTPGTGYDRIKVTGSAVLGGTLVVTLVNGFTPAAHDAFDVLDFEASRISGTFSAITLPALPAGLHWDTTQLYTTGTIRIIPEGLTFSAWAAANGIPGALPGGDHDSDGYDNATEFALGLFPPQPDTTEPNGGFHTYAEGQRLRLLFTRPLDRTGVTLRVQAADDLATWTDVAVSVDSAPFTGAGFVSENRAHPLPEPGLVEVRDILNTSATPRRQMRLQIEIAP